MLRRLGVNHPEVELHPGEEENDPPAALIRSRSFQDLGGAEGWVWGLLAEEPLFCPAWISRVTCTGPQPPPQPRGE